MPFILVCVSVCVCQCVCVSVCVCVCVCVSVCENRHFLLIEMIGTLILQQIDSICFVFIIILVWFSSEGGP